MTGKSKPRDLAKQETREALIRAGMQAFTEEGVDLPSLDAICARAGFTRGAFYVHFKDREDFFAAVADQAVQDFVNWVIPPGQSEAGLHGVVDRFVGALEDGQRTAGDLHKLLMQIVARGSQGGSGIGGTRPPGPDAQPYQDLIRAAMDRVAEAAERGQLQGEVRRDLRPDQLGLLLVSAAVGFIGLLGGGLQPDFPQVRALLSRLLFTTDAGYHAP